MKYSHADIIRLKSSTDLLAYSTHLGLNMQKVGSRYRACCPFHHDKTPSFYITPETGYFYCFGCQKKGDIITLARDLKHLSFPEALADIQSYSQSAPLQTIEPECPTQTKLDRHKRLALEDVVSQSQQNLNKSSRAKAYLRNRGISDDTVQNFEIGYFDNDQIELTGSSSSHLQQIGFLNKWGKPSYEKRITIPIRNEKQEITQLYGRQINLSRNKHYYLRMPHSTLFNPDALRFKEIYLCESIIDTLSLKSQKIENVCGIYGTNSLKNAYIQQMCDNGVEHVVIAYDNDLAGNRSAITTQERLEKESIQVSRLKLPEGMDINESILQTGHSNDVLNQLYQKHRYQ